MRVLVADDDALFHKLADAVLLRDGYQLLHARDGLEALGIFEDQRPDLVLTDYQMPGMNGIDLCRKIKQLEPDRFVPVVMLTGEGESRTLKESLEAGVVEFLTKPVNPDELRLRIRSLADLITLHTNLALAKTESDEEMLIAKHILHRLVEPGLLEMPGHVHMETIQTRRINGDACTYRQGIPGVHFGFICDATGHGLTAGISTIPAIQAFLSMVSRDIPLEIIYREINTRLRQMLPPGRFVCLLLTRLDLHNGTLSLLNAGLPDALLLTPTGQRRFESRNLPAGVVDDVGDPVVEEAIVHGGERLLSITDGIQEVLGETEAYTILTGDQALRPFTEHRDAIQACLRSAVQNQEQHDDVSWSLWEVPRDRMTRQEPAHGQSTLDPRTLTTTLSFELSFDPRRRPIREVIPDCLRFLTSHGVPAAGSQGLAVVLTEAATNAIDHGILSLDSALKESGFEAYDAVRRERLSLVEAGTVSLRLRLLEDGDFKVRAVGVEVEDSGPGFDWRSWIDQQQGVVDLASGRGLLIIRSMALDFSFNEAGNCLRFSLPCG